VLFHAEYDAFGAATEYGAGYGDTLKYTARELDADTGLQYNRARWYDNNVGRWLSEDPIGFAAGDHNLYRYVSNFATGATDPSGLQAARKVAGKDITDALSKTIREFRVQFNKLSVAGRVDLARGLFNFNTGTISWDIEEFYKTEDKANLPWAGPGLDAKFVTVNGKSYFAGEVNYVLWGAVNREIFDMVHNDKNVPSIRWWSYAPVWFSSQSGLVVGYDGRPARTHYSLVGSIVVQQAYSLDQALTYVSLWRNLFTMGGLAGPGSHWSQGLDASWI
jgi:RHS repeat-associated protein